MENSNECDDNKEEITLEYFKKWGERSQKTERVYIRVFPETKERLLLACKQVDLTLSDFVTGAALEASSFILEENDR
jgi:uncharacterized protein (DUF1778 family)